MCDLHLVGEGQVVRNDVVCIGGIDDARDQESVAKIFKSSPHVAGQGFRVLTRKRVDNRQLQIEGWEIKLVLASPELDDAAVVTENSDRAENAEVPSIREILVVSR